MLPYPKPVIYNHDTNTESTGRIYNAAYSTYTKSGREGIIVVPKITDPVAIQKVLDGRLLTVSIGATTNAAVCSVCGTDILSEGWCGHEKGDVYDGVLCEWVAGDLFFDELSWVNVPADQDAQVIDTGHVGFAEAYAHSNKGIVDLSRSRTEWVLTKELAMAEGLLLTEEKEGANSLKTVEELQAEVDQLTSEFEKVTTEKSGLETQLETANQTLETTKEELAAKTTEAEGLISDLKSKTNEVTEAVAAKATAEAETTQLNQTIETLTHERETLVEANAALATENHKALAERIADLRIASGKVKNREEVLETYVKRSTESLNNTLADLLAEGIPLATARIVTPLENPGVSNLGKESNVQVVDDKTGKPVTKTVEEMTNEDIVALLLKPVRNTNKN
jgi:hypothetical protein